MALAGPRKEAQQQGLTRYSTGKPCVRGHMAERFVSTKSCVACSTEKASAWTRANPERVNAAAKVRRARNPDQAKQWQRASYQAHQAQYFAAAKRRKLVIKQRTPSWADLRAIDAIYVEARARREAGENVVVDHIIPLRGEFVSGFHIHTNLQIIPARDNLLKSNSFDEGVF